MTSETSVKPEYGNWVSKKFVYVPGVLCLVFGGLAFLIPASIVLSVIFLLCSIYFAYARHLFSPKGANIQAKVQNLLLEHLSGWDGKGDVLDIGCGNGSLTIHLAKRYPEAHLTGIDHWGKAWEYSKRVCDENAEAEGVQNSVSFEKASAASLPFEDDSFDLVVSNLVFHEVQEVKDKTLLIKEALRVVKKGGFFTFQDLFLWKQVYGDVEALLEMIRGWGIDTVEISDTSKAGFIPRILKLPFMLGTIGVLYGRK